MTDTRLLKATMTFNGDTIQILADEIGVNRQNASVKINGNRDFKQSELLKIAMRYKLSPHQFCELFFGEMLTGGVTDEREGMCSFAGQVGDVRALWA